MIEEIPAPISLLFAGYVIGAGYLALRSFMGMDKFHKLENFDKFMLSTIFGILAFTLIILIFNIPINLTDNNSLASFLKGSPILFLFNIVIARILMSIWIFFQNNVFTKHN